MGIYGKGMHNFVLREMEVGFRVASVEDSEHIGFGPLFDLQYNLWVASEEGG